MNFIYLIIAAVVFVVFTIMALINRYRRCPSDKILVIYGSKGKSSAKCIHGGGAFVWPVIEDYAYLSLIPISIDANLTNALSRQNIRVDVPSRFTVGISTDPEYMTAAAERLLGLTPAQIQELARDILFGQLRLVIATMSIEELNNDRDKFLENISANVEVELKKIGLRLINVNVTDIKDESGYIEALGREAAARAINEAKVRVAEQEKVGEIGKAEAVRETRIRTADANAQAVKGENEAKVEIANSEAYRREREAEAQRKASAAEKVQQARALEEAYAAERDAELARAERERSTELANVIIPQEIEKQRLIIAAEAEAEQKRVNAKGEADAIYAKMEAEAKGLYEILTKQAEGYEKMVQAAGGDANKAYMLLLLEKLPELVKTQVEAVKGIKIDQVTVWDNGSNGADGKGSTANFVSGLMKSVPPLSELFDMAGLNLPEYLAKKKNDTETVVIEQLPEKKKA
ncbi:MAG: flotillin family protein [Bacteroidaceae bacterium]|nr:flotillin family protein [Bacteroidaceae bacterium]MBQ5706368.1 flotillin family protein [Bacteroidaceae bacterium]